MSRHDTATRVDIGVIDTLCSYLEITIGELLEHQTDNFDN
ncbi:helix-turn-helix domain-containing protein [Vibrio inusitatus]|nr:helix-turn-helix transcriptional regulator [Vibrio inusitatus]